MTVKGKVINDIWGFGILIDDEDCQVTYEFGRIVINDTYKLKEHQAEEFLKKYPNFGR